MTHEEAEEINRLEFQMERQALIDRALRQSKNAHMQYQQNIDAIVIKPPVVFKPIAAIFAKKPKSAVIKRTQQRRERTTNVVVDRIRDKHSRAYLYPLGGTYMPLIEIVKQSVVKIDTLKSRIQSGWTVEDAISKPPAIGRTRRRGWVRTSAKTQGTGVGPTAHDFP